MNNENNKSGFFYTVYFYLKKNWLILALCILSAFVMWGLILKDENPQRTKNIKNVQLVLEGEADLLSRQLVVVGDREKVLPHINVQVSTDLLKYSKLSEQDVTASVDLRKVNGAGQYELSVNATSTNGSVVRVTPETVTVNIDRFNNKKIPVEVVTVNELDEGLELGEMRLSKDTIQLEGANSIISNIVKACYEVDLKNVKESMNESVVLTLLDNSNNPVSSNEIYGEIPSVNISLTVFACRELEFDIDGALVNKDLMNKNYELVSAYTVPEKIKVIAKDQSCFDDFDKIPLSGKINLTGAKKNIKKKMNFELGEDMWLSDANSDADFVYVHLTIQEKQVKKTFEKMEVIVTGENKDYSYGYVIKNVDVTITCSLSMANKIERENIKLYASVKNILPSDEYCYAPIKYEFTSGIDPTEVYVDLSHSRIKFLIANKDT